MQNALLLQLQRYHPVPEADRDLINAAFDHRIYKEGDVLFQPVRICRELFFICNGIIRIKVINEDGNEVTHYFLKENQFCTILNSFNNQVVAHESIQAACDLEVLAIARQALENLYGKIVYLRGIITQIIQQALIDKINLRNLYLGRDSTERYRLFLDRQPEIAQRVSLGDIASYLEVTPQSLSRIRKNIR